MNLLNTTHGNRAQAQEIKLTGKNLKLSPNDIKVFDPTRQHPNGSSPCAQNNGGCSHLCLAAESSRGYSCSCPTGFPLQDSFNCKEDNEEILLLALTNSLIKISLDTEDYSDTVIPIEYNLGQQHNNIVALDYDPVDKMVYWTDQNAGINRAHVKTRSDQEQILIEEINHPDGMAIDYHGRNIFWTDTGSDRIEVARLDGTFRKVLISHDLDEARDISLDHVNGFMYWSDWGKLPRIERAWMDGTHREIIVQGKQLPRFLKCSMEINFICTYFLFR